MTSTTPICKSRSAGKASKHREKTLDSSSSKDEGKKDNKAVTDNMGQLGPVSIASAIIAAENMFMQAENPSASTLVLGISNRSSLLASLYYEILCKESNGVEHGYFQSSSILFSDKTPLVAGVLDGGHEFFYMPKPSLESKIKKLNSITIVLDLLAKEDVSFINMVVRDFRCRYQNISTVNILSLYNFVPESVFETHKDVSFNFCQVNNGLDQEDFVLSGEKESCEIYECHSSEYDMDSGREGIFEPIAISDNVVQIYSTSKKILMISDIENQYETFMLAQALSEKGVDISFSSPVRKKLIIEGKVLSRTALGRYFNAYIYNVENQENIEVLPENFKNNENYYNLFKGKVNEQ